MRSVGRALAVVQTGSFVPAQAASLPVFDRLFTRVGASDDIAGGPVDVHAREMSELTEILHDAGPDSLVLLDEVGRGTATTDGRAIARAAAEFIHDELGATAIFATHYHDLTDLAAERERVFNLHFTATREDGDVTFLHRIVPGALLFLVRRRGRRTRRRAGARRRAVPFAGDRRHCGCSPDSEAASEDDESDGRDAPAEEEKPDGQFRSASSSRRGERGRRRRRHPSASDDVPNASDTDGNIDTPTADDRAGVDAESDLTADLRDLDLARMTPIEALNALHDLQSRADDDG